MEVSPGGKLEIPEDVLLFLGFKEGQTHLEALLPENIKNLLLKGIKVG